jgi:5-methyltetrahydrofolate--homocysteine methyltransferase
MRAGQVHCKLHFLKEGEAKFIEQATICQSFGASVIVMAFDENGQADTLEKKVTISERAYKILTEQVGFAPQDIIFDPQHICHCHRHRRTQ